MNLVKLCPACNEENPVSEVICRVCMTNLASVSPVPAGSAKAPPERRDEPEKTDKPDKIEEIAESGPASPRTLHAPAVLTFQLPNGRAVPVGSGEILGRSGERSLFFQDFQTVSRRHAKVDFRDGGWQIEDLQSTNGTWINGRRLDPGQPCPLKTGDVVALSLACEMRIVGW
ncbi:MAG: FHA domain-containing protein [Synergistaceae bacterium]|jgi:hypothetical protein|nr:FHA domain-containing protein [Synergistaceae bacterium]